MRKRTLSIRCKICGNEVFLYIKLGKGHLIRCWKNRIITNHSLQKEGNIYCTCGNLIGIDKNLFIKIKKHHIEIQ